MAVPDDSAVVYVPARPSLHGTGREVIFETRGTPDGLQLALAFTSLDGLVKALGDQQPWVALSVANYRGILADQGIRNMIFDPPMPEGAWRWTPERFNDFAGVSDQ